MSVRNRHPLHPAFVHFPIAFWMSAILLDVLQWSSLMPGVPGIDGFALPHLLLWAGLATALPAVTAGLIDYAKLPASVQGSRPLMLHMLCMGTAFVLYLCAGIWRVKTGEFAAEPPLPVVLLEVTGALALIVGGYLASRVVFEILPGVSGDSEPR